MWTTIMTTVIGTGIGAAVGVWIKSVLGTKTLRQAAAGTPAMAEAAQTFAERDRDRQLALHGFELWSYRFLPGGEIRQVERPALTPVTYAERKSRELEPPNIEDPAA
jgi:hypothetical protein